MAGTRFLCFASELHYPKGGALDYVGEVASLDAALAWCRDMVQRTATRDEGPCECSVLVLQPDGTAERWRFFAEEGASCPEELELEAAPNLLRWSATQ